MFQVYRKSAPTFQMEVIPATVSQRGKFSQVKKAGAFLVKITPVEGGKRLWDKTTSMAISPQEAHQMVGWGSRKIDKEFSVVHKKGGGDSDAPAKVFRVTQASPKNPGEASTGFFISIATSGEKQEKGSSAFLDNSQFGFLLSCFHSLAPSLLGFNTTPTVVVEEATSGSKPAAAVAEEAPPADDEDIPF